MNTSDEILSTLTPDEKELHAAEQQGVEARRELDSLKQQFHQLRGIITRLHREVYALKEDIPEYNYDETLIGELEEKLDMLQTFKGFKRELFETIRGKERELQWLRINYRSLLQRKSSKK